jgi:transposase
MAMLFEREGIKIFVYREPIDMRAGFERLHEFCVQHMRAKINEGHAYVFFGKNRSRMKCLMYDGSGLVLIAKRIERRRFMSHAELLGRTEISMSEFRQIFHGGVVGRPVFGIEADELDMKSMESSPLIEKILSTQRERLALPAGLMNALLQGDGFRESQTTDR